CGRPGLAAAVAAGQVAAAPPPPPPAAGGAALTLAGGVAPAAAATAAVGGTSATAPWELMPYFREALAVLELHLGALGGACGLRGCNPGATAQAGSGGCSTEAGMRGARSNDDAGDWTPLAWPGLFAMHVRMWREAQDDEDEQEEEEGGIRGGNSRPESSAAKNAEATRGACSSLDGAAVVDGETTAAADIESLAPPKAAARVLLALEAAGGVHGKKCPSAAAAAGAAGGTDLTATAASPAEVAAAAEQRVALLSRLCGAQAQLLWLLFGVDCPWRDSSWGFRLPGVPESAEAAAAGASTSGTSSTVSAFEPSTADALLLWRNVGPHAVLLAAPPKVPGLGPEAVAALEEGFTVQLQDLLPTLELLARVLPPLPQATIRASCAFRYLHDRRPDNLLLALDPTSHLPAWLRQQKQPPASAPPAGIAAEGEAAAAEAAVAGGVVLVEVGER
ncbi:hypothetical protein Agub_g7373, partial [Astrephomene gubernaculifera]